MKSSSREGRQEEEIREAQQKQVKGERSRLSRLIEGRI